MPVHLADAGWLAIRLVAAAIACGAAGCKEPRRARPDPSGPVEAPRAPAAAPSQLATVDADGRVLLARVSTYRGEHGTGKCPDLEELKLTKILQMADNSWDPWNHPYRIVCQADGVIRVGSSGPDGVEGTADDLWVQSR